MLSSGSPPSWILFLRSSSIQRLAFLRAIFSCRLVANDVGSGNSMPSIFKVS